MSPVLSEFTLGSAFGNGGADLLAENGATINSPKLETLNGITLTVSDTSSVSLDAVSNIDGSNITAEGGATVYMPGVQSYSSPGLTTLEANGGVLDLRNLNAISAGGYQVTIEAESGGTINLGDMNTLAANVNLEASGDSDVEMPNLTSFSVGSGFADGGASFSVSGGSTADMGGLTSLNGVTITIDATSTLQADQWTQLVNSSLTVSGQSYTFSGMNDIFGSTLIAQAGAFWPSQT